MCLIYAVRNKINGHMYIGSTTNWVERQKSHRATLKGFKKSPTRLYEAGKKYTVENFDFIILENNIDCNKIFEIEDEWILKFDTINNGYNIKLATETNSDYEGILSRKEKMRYKVPGNLKIMTPEEWIQRRKEDPGFSTYSLKIKGVNSTKKIVYKIDTQKNIIEKYSSMSELAKILNCRQNSVAKRILKNKGAVTKFAKYKGGIYVYAIEYDTLNYIEPVTPLKPSINYKRPGKPITLQNIETQEIKKFNSRKEAARYLGVSYVKIHCLIRGYNKREGGKLRRVLSIKNWKIV